MTITFILLLVLAFAGLFAALVRLVVSDGYGRTEPPRSRVDWTQDWQRGAHSRFAV